VRVSGAVQLKTIRFAFVSMFSHTQNLTAFMECIKHMKGADCNIFWTDISRTERKQLEAIFYLKKQHDKFHVNSIEDLEDKLRL
jgi:hypothetical protein